jgi:hypothetical protein
MLTNEAAYGDTPPTRRLTSEDSLAAQRRASVNTCPPTGRCRAVTRTQRGREQGATVVAPLRRRVPCPLAIVLHLLHSRTTISREPFVLTDGCFGIARLASTSSRVHASRMCFSSRRRHKPLASAGSRSRKEQLFPDGFVAFQSPIRGREL